MCGGIMSIQNQSFFRNIRIFVTFFITIFIVLIFPLSRINSKTAYAQGTIENDFIILVDMSGSMNFGYPKETDPSLWTQLKPNIKKYVENLPTGSNVVLFTFNTEIITYGPWNDIRDSQKQEIQELIDGLKPEPKNTRLWDTVCQAVDYMTNLQKDSNTPRFQTLISFTDGKDTTSTKKPEECLGNYNTLCSKDNVYWFYFAYKDAEVPPESDCIRIIDDPQVAVINTVKFEPMTLNLGNLYETGRSINKCFVFWASYPGLYGNQGFKLDMPQLVEGSLPSNVTLNVCEAGTDCNRERITIDQNPACLDFSLVNYDPNNMGSAYSSHIVYELPILVPPDANENYYIYPESISIELDLIAPTPTTAPTRTPTHTSTPSPTITETPTSTFTLTPTETKIFTPTPTEQPWLVTFDCDETDQINLGTLEKPSSDQLTSVTKSCKLTWENGDLQPNLNLNLTWDKEDLESTDLSKYIWFINNGNKVKSIELDQASNQLVFVVEIPYNDWKLVKKSTFTGNLEVIPKNVELTGNAIVEEIQFSLKPPLSPIWYAIPVLAILALAGLVVVFTRPRFPQDVQIECQGQVAYPASANKDFWTGSVYLGGGAKSIMAIGDETENCLKITPNQFGSKLAQLFKQRSQILYELTPLGDTKIDLLGSTMSSMSVPDNSDFTVITPKRRYMVKILSSQNEGVMNNTGGVFGSINESDSKFNGF